MSDDNSRSPYEQGELQSSPSPEFVRTKHKKERQQSPSSRPTIDDIIVVDRDSEDDTLDIKPPQVQTVKRDKSHKHKHKEDKHRDRDRRDRDHGRDRDRQDRVRIVHIDRHRTQEITRDRQPERLDRTHSNRDKRGDHRDYNRDRGFERVERVVELRETREEREVKETKKREQSQMERERLEEKERMKQREVRSREIRKADEREKRKLEEKRSITSRQVRDKSRDVKSYRSRSRESHRKGQPEKRDEKKPKEPPLEKTVRKRGPRTPEEPLLDKEPQVVIEVDPSSPEHEPELVPSESEAGSETETESDSSSDSSDAGGNDSDDNDDESDDGSNKQENENVSVHSTGKVKSKFEHSDNESAQDSGSDENRAYIEDSPPPSPIEEEVKLPPYLPAIQGCRSVEEFRCLNRIEEGTYGVVYRAKDKKNDEIVALKRLKMEKEKEGFPITSLREINTLLKAQHQNIVTVREIVVGSNMDKIYIVMDYVEHDLKSLMEVMKSPFSIGETKTLMKQLLRAVNHLHDNWILHRDLKTSNLLFSHKGILKVGDFGLAREYGSPLRQYTPIVVTLWYRAPELLLGCKQYSTAIDMWSVGCIFAEFLTMKPLWPGKSEIDELNRIFKDLGTPNEKIWPGVSELPGMKKCTFTEYPYNTIRNRFGTYLSDSGADLLNRFLAYSPTRRTTAEEGIGHKYFTESPLPVDPSMFPTWPAKSEQPRTGKHASSPKPPSGGKAYSRLVSEEDNLGFHMSTAGKGAAVGSHGFTLKF